MSADEKGTPLNMAEEKQVEKVRVELTRQEAEIAIRGCVSQCTFPGEDATSLVAERAFRKLRGALRASSHDPAADSGARHNAPRRSHDPASTEDQSS